jgi:Cu2+-exporting ATPase
MGHLIKKLQMLFEEEDMNEHKHSDHEHHHHNADKQNGNEKHAERDMHENHNKHKGNDHDGHDKHAGHSVEGFLKKFIVSTIITIPVLALSYMIQQWLGFEFTFTGDKYVLGGLATLIFLYGGFPFLKGLYDEVRTNSIGMMTLIGVAISAAWAYSFAVTLGLEGMDFYWEMATLIDIMLLGHWLEMKSVKGASQALELLVKMMPSNAHLVQNGETKDVPVEDLKENDIVAVKPGEKIPVDGILIDGEGHLDESMLTGESKPIKKKKDDHVIGGSVNGNGSLKVKVLHTGKDSYLNKVIKLVENAQKLKSKTQNLADRAAKILTFVSLGGGVITLIAWLALGFKFVYALERMVTVMVISCPHALGLAVPLVVAISTTMSAKRGLLIRNRTAFENARHITTIVFDKTGTLTKGSHELSEIKLISNKYDEKELLRLASGIEQHSEHYIAKGLMRKAKAEEIKVPASEKFNNLPGKGIEGIVEGKEIKVVGPNYLKENKIEIPDNAQNKNSSTIVYILIDSNLAGYFSFADQIREESFDAIKTLKNKGIKNLLLTGDNDKVAKKVSNELKMDGFLANVLPHQKLEKVKELQQKGEFVAMTGDGINDAPALAQANVGIAVGSGTDIAAETADIVLVNSNPMDIANLILFGRATYKKMIQNLVWATGYNIIAIPLAAGILYNYGIVLSPAIGAVLMSLSTILVAINAQLLRKSMK